MFNGKYGKAVAIFSPISSPSQRPKGEILTGLLILWGKRCRSIQHRHGRCDCKTKSDLLIWLIWPWKYAHPYIYTHTILYYYVCIYIYTCTYSGHVTQKCLVLVFGMAAHDFYWDGVHVVHGDLINCGSSSVKGVPIFKKQSGLPHCHWGVRIILYNGSDLGVPQ